MSRSFWANHIFRCRLGLCTFPQCKRHGFFNFRKKLFKLPIDIVYTQLNCSDIYAVSISCDQACKRGPFTRRNPSGTNGVNDCSQCISGIRSTIYWG